MRGAAASKTKCLGLKEAHQELGGGLETFQVEGSTFAMTPASGQDTMGLEMAEAAAEVKRIARAATPARSVLASRGTWPLRESPLRPRGHGSDRSDKAAKLELLRLPRRPKPPTAGRVSRERGLPGPACLAPPPLVLPPQPPPPQPPLQPPRRGLRAGAWGRVAEPALPPCWV